jgi:hypothetical protein
MIEDDDKPDDHIDAELDCAEMAAAEMLSHVKQAGVVALELPMIDESGVWVVSVKRLGISEDGESE